jgi:D-alanyl-D-alanine carboxypeptidase
MAGAIVTVVGLTLVPACGSSGSSSPQASGSASASTTLPAYAATLQTQIPTLMQRNAIPGVVVMIESRDKGNWSSMFGTQEIGKDVPMSIDDYFRIGSNTKTMTSTVILQLVQESRLSLDDPISKYRPDVPNGEHITIAQLSEMRSGLYSYTFDKAFNETLDRDPQKAWAPDELLSIAFSHPPDFPPGQKYEYSNTNIILLGTVIEKLTGMPASEAFRKRIFEPLGLKHTSLPVATDALIPDPHPQGYQFGTNVEDINSYAVPPAQLPAALNGTLKPINNTNANPSWAWAAGGAISTASDLTTYVKVLVDGGLLDAATQKLRLDSVKPITAAGPLPAYGLGIVEFAPNVFGHDGQIPGYSTFMVHDAKAGNTVIIGTNLAASPASGENAAVVLGKAVIAALYGASVVPGGDPAGAATSSAASAAGSPTG